MSAGFNRYQSRVAYGSTDSSDSRSGFDRSWYDRERFGRQGMTERLNQRSLVTTREVGKPLSALEGICVEGEEGRLMINR